jgi:DNA-binding CsgD family transcriptional regulator
MVDALLERFDPRGQPVTSTISAPDAPSLYDVAPVHSPESGCHGLVGREDEIERLCSLVDSASGGGGALIVLGDPGTGKSALLSTATEHAALTGVTVLESAGVECERDLPYAGLDSLLRPILDTVAVLPSVQREALLTAVGLARGPAPEPVLLGLAVLNLISEAAAGGAVLIAVDDVHRLDAPTHETLAFVARRVERAAFAMIATARTGSGGPLLTAGLPELGVPVLSEAAARGLLARTAPDLSPTAREEILRDALGNPLAIVELPITRRTGDSSRPLTARLERSFAGSFGGLSDDARDAVLAAAAAQNGDLTEIVLAGSVLAGHELSVDALDAAMAAGLLRFDEIRVQFRHPLVRSAVLQAETPSRRRAAHAALAEAVHDDAFRHAWHRAHAIVGPDDSVADELELGHVAALRRGSPLAAIWALERSAQLSTDSSLRARRPLLAAEYAFDLGRSDMVDRMLDAASRSQLSDLDLARAEWLREIFNDGVPGDAARVFELCTVVRQSLAAGDLDLALNLLLAAALRCWWAEPGRDARAEVVKAARELPNPGNDPRVVAALAVADWNGNATEVIAQLDKVVLETVDDPSALRLLGAAAHAVGHTVRSIDFLTRAETKLREQGRLGLLVHVLNMQILNWLEIGDWDAASDAIEEARQLSAETGQPLWENVSIALAAVLAGLRGDNDEAQALASQTEKFASGGRLNALLVCVQMARGFGWISTGGYSEAYDALRRMFDPSDPSFHSAERNHAIMFLAEAAVRVDRIADARSVIAALDEEAKTVASPILHVQLSYARAVLADDDHAEEFYLEALTQNLTRWPWARARIELAYGTWLRRHRRASESRAPLRAARTTLELVGARRWADQARAELRAAGGRDPGAVPRAHDALSAQEMEIARLASAGLSNREIGERLYLSHRTVGSHLYRIFPKLNITSRGQLTARLEPT